MKFLLDSNAVIALMKGHPGFLAQLRQHQPADFAMPSIVAHELFYGAYKGQRMAENLARVEALQFEVLEFDREDAQRAAELRALLAAAGTPIGPYDVLIAGQAWARDLTLITHNLREFQRVPHIRVEDWEI
ncbi:type II toxin-antitoxin system VapC family toxin [Pollutimonas bauzanensis]|nr:type II toxin-antitoxin system VapC family toxin [Pollutimonas bauzanensis]